jgi:aminoglycoside phosphotransferase (APT) family kinase protein
MVELEFADINKAKEIVKNLYPEAKNITFVEHGYDNLIALVDEKYAVRFPRNENAYLRSLHEKEILSRLGTMGVSRVPRLLGNNDNPPYLITNFVHGSHLRPSDIRELPQDQQKRFAEEIAEFAYAFHTMFTLDEARVFRTKFRLDELSEEPWDLYLKKKVSDSNFPTEIQNRLAHECYEKWVNIKQSGLVIVHDDLHTENLMFENNELVGILDFGDTNIGTPEQDLRQLYRISDFILESAIKKYDELSGLSLNIEAAKLWCIMQELAVYSSTDNFAHHSYARAAKNLNRWLPEGKWGEGMELDEGKSFQ